MITAATLLKISKLLNKIHSGLRQRTDELNGAVGEPDMTDATSPLHSIQNKCL